MLKPVYFYSYINGSGGGKIQVSELLFAGEQIMLNENERQGWKRPR